MNGTIDKNAMLEKARTFRAEFDRQAAENAAMRAELDAADAAYVKGVNSIYEPDAE